MENKEIWKYIKNYGNISKYQISNKGRIRTLSYDKTGKIKILKTSISNSGYEYIILRDKNGNHKNVLIHRLVAQAFVPNKNNLKCVNHKDENKQNNCADNLEWCTYSYNNSYGKMKIREKRRKAVKCIELNKIFNSITEAGQKLNILHSHISQCCQGKRKTTGGYHWKYVN